MQGVDLLTSWAQRSEKDRTHLAEEDHEGNVLRALRTLDWKYLEANEDNPRGLPTRELFDMRNDPAEKRSLIDQRPEIATDLRTKADATQEWAKAHATAQGGEAELSKDAQDRLRALGYIE